MGPLRKTTKIKGQRAAKKKRPWNTIKLDDEKEKHIERFLRILVGRGRSFLLDRVILKKFS